MEVGLKASYKDPENGMILEDMEACEKVADRHNEVIIFRSTGPWSMRWIEDGYPTKNFHVKGKSSDWGPQAGLVPFLGGYSKVGHDQEKADEGTKKNRQGIASGFTEKTPLVLTDAQISRSLTRAEGKDQRVALDRREELPHGDAILHATRPKDQKKVSFVAKKLKSGSYAIMVPDSTRSLNPFLYRDWVIAGKPLVEMEVMTSNEVGAGTPLTGDYDLFAVCPSWGDYGSGSTHVISKPALKMISMPSGGHAPKDISFPVGMNMDRVLDQRLHSMSKVRTKAYGTAGKWNDHAWDEHEDMGNLTPRLLRTINALNSTMRNGSGAMRRVHHNAESHRNDRFGAITGAEMWKDNEGFPLTVFQPSRLAGHHATSRYQRTCTLHTMQEFVDYAAALHGAGYYVPKNWTWGMGSLWADKAKNWPG